MSAQWQIKNQTQKWAAQTPLAPVRVVPKEKKKREEGMCFSLPIEQSPTTIKVF